MLTGVFGSNLVFLNTSSGNSLANKGEPNPLLSGMYESTFTAPSPSSSPGGSFYCWGDLPQNCLDTIYWEDTGGYWLLPVVLMTLDWSWICWGDESPTLSALQNGQMHLFIFLTPPGYWKSRLTKNSPLKEHWSGSSPPGLWMGVFVITRVLLNVGTEARAI